MSLLTNLPDSIQYVIWKRYYTSFVVPHIVDEYKRRQRAKQDYLYGRLARDFMAAYVLHYYPWINMYKDCPCVSISNVDFEYDCSKHIELGFKHALHNWDVEFDMVKKITQGIEFIPMSLTFVVKDDMCYFKDIADRVSTIVFARDIITNHCKHTFYYNLGFKHCIPWLSYVL